MKTFREFLDEKLFKKVKTTLMFDKGIKEWDIYINPTADELNEYLFMARGFIDLKGNVYLIDTKGARVIHSDLLEFLSAVVRITNTRTFHTVSFKKLGGIAIIRNKGTAEIKFSESVVAGFGDKTLKKKSLKEAGPIVKKAGRKNPVLQFFPGIMIG